MSVFLRTVRLVLGFVVFKGLTRVRGSNYPLDTKFLTLSVNRSYRFMLGGTSLRKLNKVEL